MARYVVDALNICKESRSHPDLSVLFSLLLELKKKGHEFICVFDQSAYNEFKRLGGLQLELYGQATKAYSRFFSQVRGKADPMILTIANIEDESVISNDIYREFKDKYSWLKDDKRLITVSVAGNYMRVDALAITTVIKNDLRAIWREFEAMIDPGEQSHEAAFSSSSNKRDWKSKRSEKQFILSDLTIKDISCNIEWTRNANTANKKLTRGDANKVLRELNTHKYAGHGDWRFPDSANFRVFLEYADVDDEEEDFLSYSYSGGPEMDYYYGVDMDPEYYNVRERKGTLLVATLLNIGFLSIQPESYWCSGSGDNSDYSDFCDLKYAEIKRLVGPGTFILWPVRDL